MIVPVALVISMAVAVVDVVDVVGMRHCDVSTARPVLVVVVLVHGVTGGFALVGMPVVNAVQMTVVRIVDVVGMRHGNMAATTAVLMGVPGVRDVNGGRHVDSLACVLLRLPP
ncbi:hypothetical protein GCM10010289_59100 [Streptomyces violascens]|nr:hypothetical protein GCM10010289_59100 [Streptomyces violascens]